MIPWQWFPLVFVVACLAAAAFGYYRERRRQHERRDMFESVLVAGAFHGNLDALIDFVDGRLHGTTLEIALAHLDECEECRWNVQICAALRAALDDDEKDRTVEAISRRLRADMLREAGKGEVH